MDFRAGLLRGKPVLSWWEGRYVFGVGKVGEYVIVDASYREVARFSSARRRRPDFHEVLLTEDGTLLVTAYETRPADLTAVGGPSAGLVYGGVVQELAVPSGRLLWEWRSLDHVAVTETVSDQIGSPFDYFHINGIEVDHDGNLLVSARNTSALYKVSRRTGTGPVAPGRDAERLLDGQGNAVRLPARCAPARGRQDDQPVRQRAAAGRAATGIAGDRARGRPAPPAGDAEAGDPAPSAALRVRDREQPAPAEREPARHLGDHGVVHRVRRRRPGLPRRPPADPRPELPRLPVPLGRTSRRAAGVQGLPPGAGAARLYASWNGSTALAAWRLETGRKPGALRPGGAHPKRGFETTFAVPPRTRYAAAVALDASGKPLARSRTTRLY